MRCRGDRGVSLVDLVIGLALTTIAATTVVVLLSGATGRVEGSMDDGPDVALVADQFGSDVRDGQRVEVARRSGAGVWAVDLVASGRVVRWEVRRGVLTRWDLSDPSPRVLMDGVASTPPFELLDSGSDRVDPRRSEDVRLCTRLVRLVVGDEEGNWSIDRTVALRAAPEVGTC